VSQYGIAFGFFSELEKIAAPGQQQQAMPTSPLQIENQALTEELQNIQLKLQLRQMRQAEQAMAQQDMQQAMAAQMGGQGQPQGGGQMQMPSGLPGGPTSPQEMVGE
jgi:hypothetical protein